MSQAQHPRRGHASGRRALPGEARECAARREVERCGLAVAERCGDDGAGERLVAGAARHGDHVELVGIETEHVYVAAVVEHRGHEHDLTFAEARLQIARVEGLVGEDACDRFGFAGRSGLPTRAGSHGADRCWIRCGRRLGGLRRRG